jgi:hypothetical protein
VLQTSTGIATAVYVSMGMYLIALLLSHAAADFVVPASESGVNEEVTVRTNNDPIEWYAPEHTVVEHSMYGDTTESVYYSHPLGLETGGAVFTTPIVTTIPMPDPGKQFAILKMQYDIVDMNKRSVPLTELYVHHWLVYDTPTMGTGWNIGCGGTGTFVSNVYGAGAEVRGEHYAYPPGFGYKSGIAGRPYWSANLHFIRTQDLSTKDFNGSLGAALKSCIECEYAPGKASGCRPGLDGSGVFACCEQSARCPVNNPSDKTKVQYMLKQSLTWTTDVAKVQGVRMAVIDGFECGTLTNLVPGKKRKGTTCGDKVCKTLVTRPAPFDGTIVWGYDHQHVGALNASFSVNGDWKCSSFPHTGTDPHDTPGNSKGYIVAFKNCIDPDKYPQSAIVIKKGDSLTLEAYYTIDPADTTALPLPGGSHTGTMHLFYMFIAEGTVDEYKCSNNVCTASPGGIVLKECQAACGGDVLV